MFLSTRPNLELEFPICRRQSLSLCTYSREESNSMGDEYRGPMAPYLGVLGSFNEFDSLYA